MLLLSRKQGERVLIGEDVEVTVVEIEGDRVKLAFDAPRYVPICRAEYRIGNWPTLLLAAQCRRFVTAPSKGSTSDRPRFSVFRNRC